MTNRISKKQQFPWREGNRFQLLIDGNGIFPVMLDAIHSAQSQILLEMYLVESGKLADQFIEALSEAVRRKVTVCLLLDDYGARGFAQKDRQRLDAAGVYTVYYNPIGFWNPVAVWGWHQTMLRDHRKLLVIDNQIAFVGGIGFTDYFDNTLYPESFWHDVAVKAEGPVVGDWTTVFQRNWTAWIRKRSPGVVGPVIQELVTPVVLSSGQAGRVASGRFFGRSEIQRTFVKRVFGAEHHVWMMTAYFVPLGRLLRALRAAARRGVDVRLLLPGPETDHPSIRHAGRRHFHSLLKAGARIYEYQPRFMHAKVLLCDGWVSLGSSNVDRWNVRWNLEGNQEIEDSLFTSNVRELFEADFLQSTECVIQNWRARPWYYRWQEWFWGVIEGALDRLSESLHRGRNK